MAEKRSKSILNSLKSMLHRDPARPAEPAPKKSSGAARKRTAQPAAEKRPAPAAKPREQPTAAASSADATSAQGTAPEAKPDKKKVPNQPWYRHRQRW
jgi:hypothetical protein